MTSFTHYLSKRRTKNSVELRGLEPLTFCMPCTAVSSDAIVVGPASAGQRCCGAWGHRAVADGTRCRWPLVWRWVPLISLREKSIRTVVAPVLGNPLIATSAARLCAGIGGAGVQGQDRGQRADRVGGDRRRQRRRGSGEQQPEPEREDRRTTTRHRLPFRELPRHDCAFCHVSCASRKWAF